MNYVWVDEAEWALKTTLAQMLGHTKDRKRLKGAFVVLVLSVLLAGCAYPNQFRNVPINSSYSVLVGDHVKVAAINGQPTGFWRTSEHFRVRPGRTTVNPITGVWNFPDYPVIEFTAIAGCRYVLRHEAIHESHQVFVLERSPGATEARVVAQVEAKQQKSRK